MPAPSMTIDHYPKRGATVPTVTTKRWSIPCNLSCRRKGEEEAPEEGKPATRRWHPPHPASRQPWGSHADFPPMRGSPGGQDYSCTSCWLGRERAGLMTPKSQTTPLPIPYPLSPLSGTKLWPPTGEERERAVRERRRVSCWRDL